MKKNLLLMASAMVVLASCSSDEPAEINQGRSIEFRTSVSRATATELEDLKEF